MLLAGLFALAGSGCQPAPAVPPPRPEPQDYVISVDDLPKGWRPSNDAGGGYRTQVCGVDLEPAPPVAKASVRFAVGPVGPFVQQYVRSYDGKTAEQVITGLTEQLPGCTSYVATGTKGTRSARFMITPLALDPARPGVVTWRQVPEDNPRLVTDLAFLRRGTTVIAFLSYSLGEKPDPAVLAKAVAAVPE